MKLDVKYEASALLWFVIFFLRRRTRTLGTSVAFCVYLACGLGLNIHGH